MERTRIALALLLVLVAARVPAAVKKPGRDIPPEWREAITREAYAKLAERVAASGDKVSFTLHDFQTINAVDFATVQWLDLVTMPGGDMLGVTRVERQRQGQTVAVVYESKWRLGAPAFLDSTAREKVIGMSAADVLAEVAKEQPEAGTVVAVTSYAVTAAFQDRQRSYRAAVLWLPPAKGRDATLQFVDLITEGLDRAVREKPVATPEATAPVFPLAKDLQCYGSTSSVPQSRSASDTLNHLSGSHAAEGGVVFDCTCAANCSQTCSPTWVTKSCEDTGITWDWSSGIFHIMEKDAKEQVGSVSDGRQGGGASCAAALGCVMKRCPLGICSLSINVGISAQYGGFGFSWQVGGSPDWQEAKFEFQTKCTNSCTEVPPPDTGGGGGECTGTGCVENRDAGDGGSTGGGGFCCVSWHTSCYIDSNGWYTCTPDYCMIHC